MNRSLLVWFWCVVCAFGWSTLAIAEIPDAIRVVLANTQPLKKVRQARLPMYVLPISNTLQSVTDVEAEQILKELGSRGIGYTVDWNPSNFQASIAEGLRIAELQRKIGQPISIHATACLNRFCDGSEETLHIDASGKRYSDSSCGVPLGCPLALEHRIPVIKKQVQDFVTAYQNAGFSIDFVFADWEIDGPIEWNGSWAASQGCQRCLKEIPDLTDFRKFQSKLRQVRSKLQRDAFASVITETFPQALVGNYAVYPHGGYRYWYDYFEQPATELHPCLTDQRARYREWYQEYPECGYSMAMPVIYSWYATFDWYDFQSTDYRWFYNMLLNASNAGKSASISTPVVPFIHWHTTAPPSNPLPHVQQMRADAYQELLWHMLLRGHDTFFLWCMPNELAQEIRLAHQVYASSHEFEGFLQRGSPIGFDVPNKPGTVISGLRLGDRVLVRRSEFGTDKAQESSAVTFDVGKDEWIEVPATPGNHIVPVQHAIHSPHFLTGEKQPLFPLGWYDPPKDDADWRELAESGFNLVRCPDRATLDRAHQYGLKGWLPISVQQGATAELKKVIESVVDHPALAVWEGPDEIVWTFTAYSGLSKSAGVTKDDWYEQRENAKQYAANQAALLLPKMRDGIALVRSLDTQRRPFWMNEAADSDMQYVRGYASSVDAIGCDYYPVRGGLFDLRSIGKLVDRWHAVGRGKPVWMVLQAFSWHPTHPERGRRYPHFWESRFMAYNAIAHGGLGIFYWGAFQIDDSDFRKSLFALASELKMLQPFLVASNEANIDAVVVPDLFEEPGRGVRTIARRSGEDLLLILVNEDDFRHLAVDVRGLSRWNGKELHELYGDASIAVQHGDLSVRMRPLEVKIYCSSRRFETTRRTGRDYVSPVPEVLIRPNK